MKLIPILFIAALLFTAGCVSSVPKTTIRFNPTSRELLIQSPKNVTIGSATVLQTSNSFSLTISNYSSTNDNLVVTTVTAAQAQVAKSASDTIQSLANLASQVAAKAP